MDAEYWRVKCEQLNHDLRGEKMLTEMLRSEIQKYDEQLYQARETINWLEGVIASTNERLAARHQDMAYLLGMIDQLHKSLEISWLIVAVEVSQKRAIEMYDEMTRELKASLATKTKSVD